MKNWIDTSVLTDEQLLELALEALPDEKIELAENEPRLSFDEILQIPDEDLREKFGFDEEDLVLLNLSEEEERELEPREWLLSSLARNHIELVNQVIDYRPTKRPSKGMPGLDWSPRENWVDIKGVMKSSGDRGLPEYISRLAKQFTYAKKFTREKAIQWAVGIARRWCETGFVRPGGKGQLNPGSRAQACAAIKQWEQMKARA